ncbi:dynein regulatory complex subunit 6 [Nematostella vectensis]|uniref:dynein regulatory complex subunit 6 n=1 Tax=Nematostella vectensis TaxID=45351 RepID=UPI002076DB53|nr:dynein regulatory complex subunit 6 [Nematostella vectensis]
MQNSNFPLARLPAVVIFIIAEYLSPGEKANLSRVDKTLRRLFSTSQAWRETTFVIKANNRKKCLQVVKTLATRKAKRVQIDKGCCNDYIVKTVLCGLRDIDALTLPRVSPSTLKLISKFTPGLRRLELGEVYPWHFSQFGKCKHASIWCLVLQNLVNLEDLTIGPLAIGRGEKYFSEELKAALCCCGNLRRLVINGCDELPIKWISAVFISNPNLSSIGLCFIRHLSLEKIIPDQNAVFENSCPSSLESLDISGSLRGGRFLSWTLEWLPKLSTLTSLNLSQTMDERLLGLVLQNLTALANLRQLNLTFSSVKDNMFVARHPKLSWLELKGCFQLSSAGINLIASSYGMSLKYLGLCNCHRMTDDSMKFLSTRFPSLRVLDLSNCVAITDLFLEELYFPSSTLIQPALTKLLLRGCNKISLNMVGRVREKLANQLAIDITAVPEGDLWFSSSLIN